MKRKNGTAVVSVKTAAFMVKEAGPQDGLKEGEFVAYASVFGNVDSYGDVVEPDAFDRTLEEWKASGDVIPVLWGHDTFDPFNNIGGLHSAEAVKPEEAKAADAEKYGLKVHGFLDIADNPVAAQVYRLMKGRRTTKMSFAYAVKDGVENDHGGYDLKDLDLFEVSIVQIPANQEAEVLDVKRAATSLIKAGRTLSAKNEASLRAARDAIDAVLESLATQGDSGDDAAKASGTAPAKASVPDEEPDGAKSGASAEEPTPSPSVEAELKGLEDEFLAAAFGLNLTRKD